MTADKWDAPAGNADFVEHIGVKAIKVRDGSGPVQLKDFTFSKGTIEFDMMPGQPDFVSFFFRRKDAAESEVFYFRTARAGNPTAVDTIQYSPLIKEINLWDLLGHYQGPATIRTNEWNHLKLVISDQQMRAYVNDMSRPALEIPQLEGDTREGGLAFSGTATFANFEVRLDETDGLAEKPGIDPVNHDPRYLRRWKVSSPMPLPPGRELWQGDYPKDGAWEAIDAERRGLVNLTRRFGKGEGRRAVWLKANLQSKSAQTRRIDFGFSDEVWVFINGNLAHVDKNIYARPIMKKPGGRCSIENCSFELPLKEGLNEIVIGVANDFFGWGIIARIDSLEGIEFVSE